MKLVLKAQGSLIENILLEHVYTTTTTTSMWCAFVIHIFWTFGLVRVPSDLSGVSRVIPMEEKEKEIRKKNS